MYRSRQRADELSDESELWLAGVARQDRRLGARRLGRFPIICVGGGPGVVNKRLREHAEPALPAQPFNRSRQEPRARREVARLLRGDADVHHVDRIRHLLKPQGPHSAPHFRAGQLLIGERDDDQ